MRSLHGASREPALLSSSYTYKAYQGEGKSRFLHGHALSHLLVGGTKTARPGTNPTMLSLPPRVVVCDGSPTNDNDEHTCTITLRITGMMCQKSCGTTVENALRMLPAVVFVEASFEKSRATVTADLTAYQEGNSDLNAMRSKLQEQAVDAVECVGFDAQVVSENEMVHTVNLRVTGMMCQKSCGTTVENALWLLPGATFAEASYEQSRAAVTAGLDAYAEGGKVDDGGAEALRSKLEKEAVQAVECVGFDAEVLPSDEEQGVSRPPLSVVDNNDSRSSALECSTEQSKDTCLFGDENSNAGATFQVGGMSCAVCVGRVERAFLSVEGVEKATVTLAINRAQVLFGDCGVNVQDLAQNCVAAVTNGGYECDLIQIMDPDSHMSNLQGVSLAENAAKMEQARTQELYSWRRLLLASVVLTIPIMVVHFTQMNDMSSSVSGSPSRTDWLIFFLATPVQFGVGRRYYQAAFKAWPTMGMDALVVMGTTASYMYSIAVFLLKLLSEKGTKLNPTFETGAMLIMFVTLGKFLEAYAKGKTASALQTLMELQPVLASRVIVKESSTEKLLDQNVDISSLETQQVEVSQVENGDYLVVMPGARIPTDGVLVSTSQNNGCAYIDESALSGEPFPVAKQVGDAVFGSTVNQLSVLLLRVTATGGGTVLAKIVKLVEDAQSSRAPIQAQADAIACIFAPTVLVLATITFGGWMILVSESLEERFFLALTSAISVIVVACPCALGLATPTAVMVGTGVGATQGLLIKGGAVLESAHNVDTIVLDKTGTVTSGCAVLGERIDFINFTSTSDPLLQGLPTKVPKDHVVLWLAACAERQSEHPLAKAIVNAASSVWGGDVTCSQEGVNVSDFFVSPGSGVECLIQKDGWGVWCVRVGNKKFASELPDTSITGDENEDDISLDNFASVGDNEVTDLRRRGQVGIYVSVVCRTDTASKPQNPRRRVVGVLGIVDPIVPEARSTVAALQRMGIDVWLCTGDHEVTAASVAMQVGIDDENICANVKPEGKADLVTRLQKRQRTRPLRRHRGQRQRSRAKHQNGRVAVVGDGINDAIALARADVGVAIGAGTEVAVEAADIVLVRSSLHDVVTALHLSRVVFHRIRLNFVWAIGYNLCALPFAAGALYPLTNWRLPPEFAGLMMAFSSVSVVSSSLLLRTYSKPLIHEDGELDGTGCVEYLCNLCSRGFTRCSNSASSFFYRSAIEYDNVDVSSEDDSNIELV